MDAYREKLLVRLEEVVRELTDEETEKVIAYVETLQSQHIQ